ncbi:hypothetical protein ACFLU5_00135 [Bacteroidota bacterium]
MCLLFRIEPIISQVQVLNGEADSLHGVILKPGINGVERPADMFQQNCSDCHTEAIMYYSKYSQLWDTTFRNRDKYIHTWITPFQQEPDDEYLLVAKGINYYNDTTPVKNAMIALYIKDNAGWQPVSSQILLTNDSGQATVKISPDIVGGRTGRLELLIRLVDEIVYPNGKYRLRVNLEGHDQEANEHPPASSMDKPGEMYFSFLLKVLGSILLVIAGFYIVYTRYLS